MGLRIGYIKPRRPFSAERTVNTQMKRRKNKTEGVSGLRALFLGALLSCIVYLSVSLIAGLLTCQAADPTSLTGPVSLASLMISGIISSLLITRLPEGGGILTAVLSALLFVLVLLVIGLAMTGGKLPIRCPINYLCYLALCTLTAYALSKIPERRRRR